jgi:adenylate cyclase, class 2
VSVQSNREIEIKIRLNGVLEGQRLLRRAGFRVAKKRVFEQNDLFDTSERALRGAGIALRLRTAGTRHVLTFKGPQQAGRHKSREELETVLADREAFEHILARLGYGPVFRYEKYRTEFRKAGGAGTAMLDETPAGVFLELEGPPEWIDGAARSLGFGDADYITASYADIHLSAGGDPAGMTFPQSPREDSH